MTDCCDGSGYAIASCNQADYSGWVNYCEDCWEKDAQRFKMAQLKALGLLEYHRVVQLYEREWSRLKKSDEKRNSILKKVLPANLKQARGHDPVIFSSNCGRFYQPCDKCNWDEYHEGSFDKRLADHRNRHRKRPRPKRKRESGTGRRSYSTDEDDYN